MSWLHDEFVISELSPINVHDFDSPVNPQSVHPDESDFVLFGFLVVLPSPLPSGVKSQYERFKLSRTPPPPVADAPTDPLLPEWKELASWSICALRLSMPPIKCSTVVRNVLAVARNISMASKEADRSAESSPLDEDDLEGWQGCWVSVELLNLLLVKEEEDVSVW